MLRELAEAINHADAAGEMAYYLRARLDDDGGDGYAEALEWLTGEIA